MAGTDDVIHRTINVKDYHSVGYDPLVIRGLTRRSIAKEAAFFLPHLRSGMSLLDCGCGPGTITMDLAEVIAPYNVIGIDIETKQFEAGKYVL